jgi:two-component system response regulator MtrA
VPVLVLSARNDTNDKIRALKLGADDYMTKPFWPDELVERVRARLRRPVLRQTHEIEVGMLHIDVEAVAVTMEGQAVELTRVEFEFLVALARRPGVPVSRTWLVEHVLRDDRESAVRTLDVHASRVRKKLGRAELIETVWGVGYRLVRRE